MTDTSNRDIEKVIQALHTILYFRNNYPSTTEAQRIIQETLEVLQGDGRSLLCTNVSIAIGASLSNKEVQVSPAISELHPSHALIAAIGCQARMNVQDRTNLAILADDEVRSTVLHARPDVKLVALLLGG